MTSVLFRTSRASPFAHKVAAESTAITLWHACIEARSALWLMWPPLLLLLLLLLLQLHH
jgi:hypothetical protein